jgi:hypothetical protein
MTTGGVNKMLSKYLKLYDPFFKLKRIEAAKFSGTVGKVDLRNLKKN